MPRGSPPRHPKVWAPKAEQTNGPFLGAGWGGANPAFTLPSMSPVPRSLQMLGSGMAGRDLGDPQEVLITFLPWG